jgi:protein TonB
MKRSTTAHFLPAIGVSAALHVALVVFLPYRAAQLPLPPARELVPVSLAYRQLPVPASRPQAIKPLRTTQAPIPEQELSAPTPEPEPEPLTVVEPVPQEPETVKSAAPEAPGLAESLTDESERSAESSPAGSEGSAEGHAEVSPVASRDAVVEAAAPSAEIAGYQAILSALRGRIVKEIRYPAIARVSGWTGTVVLSIHLDSAGRFAQAVVRRSSGYEVLDRAAVALLRKVTPVSNPLSRPVTIEIPIAYELK